MTSVVCFDKRSCLRVPEEVTSTASPEQDVMALGVKIMTFQMTFKCEDPDDMTEHYKKTMLSPQASRHTSQPEGTSVFDPPTTTHFSKTLTFIFKVNVLRCTSR